LGSGFGSLFTGSGGDAGKSIRGGGIRGGGKSIRGGSAGVSISTKVPGKT
jgi:hypothetical protein